MMIQKNKWLQRALLASALMVAGSASAAVVTSIRPLGFIASAIADGVTPTEVLLPDGASPHDFALRPSDIQRLRTADLVLWVGPDMEAFLTKSLAQLPANKQLAISELAQVKPLLMKGDDDDDHDHDHATDSHSHAANDDGHDHHHGEYNMHIWLSPEVAKVTAIAIHDRLLELMPQNKDKLDANLRQFEDQLAQTDKNIVKMLTPVQGKGYFVFHDAYGYFEKHFGLSPIGHFTVNPEIQPGAQRLHQIRTQLVEQKAVCVFAEPQFRPAVINAVAKGTQVRSGTLDPLGIGIALGKDSYGNFLTALSSQYVSCLK
ncbi:zinc transport system substrate-binding protein [Serratia fonticola]|uniref:High-affinity zinc uptake system protein ZnuA n=1 Tax=Serratia fonticola TaxID=47917 RepID=A0A559TAM9_SERFO|nr:zinc transport system substrate-binding protein [Serratia fonticola]TQI97165.1 zinc transport system substrate-binding protein [Serratia fonticola]TVZ71661.1 zinc transport system substrate-binding protein [Serratia fonticola]